MSLFESFNECCYSHCEGEDEGVIEGEKIGKRFVKVGKIGTQGYKFEYEKSELFNSLSFTSKISMLSAFIKQYQT